MFFRIAWLRTRLFPLTEPPKQRSQEAHMVHLYSTPQPRAKQHNRVVRPKAAESLFRSSRCVRFVMQMKVLVIGSVLGIASVSPVKAQELVSFEGGIGVQPNLNVTKTSDGKIVPIPNPVRGVDPDSIPWVLRTLSATVDVEGVLALKVEGLVVAGGRGIGTSLNRSVRATLFCGSWQNFTYHNSATKTKLGEHGDLAIKEQLLPKPPNPCAAPVLLLRETIGSRWIAAGIPIEK